MCAHQTFYYTESGLKITCRLTDESRVPVLQDLQLPDAACLLEFVQVRSCKNIPHLLLHFPHEGGAVRPHFIHELGMICQILKVYIANLRDDRLQREFADLEQKVRSHDRDELSATLRRVFLSRGLITHDVADGLEFARRMLEDLNEFKSNLRFKEFLEAGVDTLFAEGGAAAPL